MLRKVLLLIPLLVVFSFELSATGPSYIRAEIRPVSVNDKGDILCRTRYVANPSGGHYELPYEYGLCVLTRDTILQFSIYTVSFEITANNNDWEQNYKVYEKKLILWDSVYHSKSVPLQMSDADHHPIIKQYGFEEANISHYKRNGAISVREFAKTRKIDLQQTPQKALYGGEGVFKEEDAWVYILHDFGNIMIIDNKDDEGCAGGINVGTRFNHPNMWGSEDIGYDCQTVTGVLFVK